MNIPPCFYRVSVKALILDDKKRFLLFKEDEDIWDLPGGGLEFNEDPTKALVREIKEESGLDIVNISYKPDYFITCQRDGYETFLANVIYKAGLKNLDFTPSPECVDIGFFDSTTLKTINTFSSVKKFAKIYDKSRH